MARLGSDVPFAFTLGIASRSRIACLPGLVDAIPGFCTATECPCSAFSRTRASFLKASKVMVGIRGTADVFGANDMKSAGTSGVGGV
jgi:hypothetical protein